LFKIMPKPLRDAPESASLPQALEERVPHLAFCGPDSILDFGKQLGLHPDPVVRDWRRAASRGSAEPALAEFGRRGAIKAMIDLSSIGQLTALEPLPASEPGWPIHA
jgi:hypothetical protein